MVLRTRFAGAEDGSRDLQFLLNLRCERVRPSKYTPGDPICSVERRDGLTEIEIVERGAVLVERPRVRVHGDGRETRGLLPARPRARGARSS